MIPEFPQFKKIEMEDSDFVESYTRNFPYYSDYNFSSLWCWDIGNQREISVLNNNLVVKFTDYETSEPFYSYLGANENLDTALTLLAFSEANGLPPSLRLMPEISMHNIDDPSLEMTQDRDNFDYIYLTAHMSALLGNQYKSKRKAADRFIRNNPVHGFEIQNLADPIAQDSVRSIAASWRKHRGVTDDDQSIIHEIDAIENIFKLAKVRSLFAGFVTVDGNPTAFTIEEIVNGTLSIGHFWKTAGHSIGEYEFLASQTGGYLSQKGVTYWNWEQDLGIEALRASKSSYRPSDFLKKFTITRRSGPELLS
jgi:hypothetical protein